MIRFVRDQTLPFAALPSVLSATIWSASIRSVAIRSWLGHGRDRHRQKRSSMTSMKPFPSRRIPFRCWISPRTCLKCIRRVGSGLLLFGTFPFGVLPFGMPPVPGFIHPLSGSWYPLIIFISFCAMPVGNPHCLSHFPHLPHTLLQSDSAKGASATNREW